ncbi:Radical SAM domain-containing protein [Candidatus Magnetoovum chiemensis]|nr:Radical SAM domain-containing protein [Candidatus Magnetoovum chiemensis]
MRIKKISFIEVRSPEAYIFRKFPIPRVGALILSTILKDRGYKVKVFIEDIAAVDWNYIEDSDAVCISSITSTAYRAYELGDRIRKLGIPVIMGGAHPSFVPQECLKHSDFVIRGEGEEPLAALLEFLETSKPDISTIYGLSYVNKDKRIIHNPKGALLKDLNTLPIPDYSLIHRWKSSHIHPVSTTRGCAYNCNFCLVAPMFGRGYRHRSNELVIEEIRKITSLSSSPLFIVDDNFAANRPIAKELLKAMISQKITPRWSAMVRADIYRDRELCRLLGDTGKFTAAIGFESVNPQTLKKYNKKQTVDDNINAIKTLKDFGIKIHGMFVFGSDFDTYDTIKQTVDFAINMKIDSIQCMVITPLPGTEFFDDMISTNRLYHTDWSKYDIPHVFFKPALIEPETLHLETLKAMRAFYSSKYALNKLLKGDFFYFAFGIYNRFSIRKALKEAKKYLVELPTIKETFSANNLVSFKEPVIR